MIHASTRIAAALCLLALARAASAQTAEQIIEKHITATGGRAAYAKAKSRLSIGTITLSTPGGEIPGPIEVLNALPNKSRTLIKVDLTPIGLGPTVFDQRFNGTAGYVVDSLQGNRDITGEMLDNLRNAAFPSIFLNYKDYGATVTLAGREAVNGRDAHVLLLEPTSGSVVRFFVDAETFLLLRMVVKVNVPQLGQDVEQTTDFSDYREVDGLKLPFQSKATSAVQNFTITFDKVEHNVKVDETLFSKPPV